jgi:predicted transcriptional regulator
MGRGTEPRSRWEIILDILKVISGKGERVKKTRIMQNAYLDWRNFQRHFSFLQEHGFVENNSDPEEGTTYYLTEKGKDLLQRLKKVKEVLQ